MKFNVKRNLICQLGLQFILCSLLNQQLMATSSHSKSQPLSPRAPTYNFWNSWQSFFNRLNFGYPNVGVGAGFNNGWSSPPSPKNNRLTRLRNHRKRPRPTREGSNESSAPQPSPTPAATPVAPPIRNTNSTSPVTISQLSASASSPTPAITPTLTSVPNSAPTPPVTITQPSKLQPSLTETVTPIESGIPQVNTTSPVTDSQSSAPVPTPTPSDAPTDPTIRSPNTTLLATTTESAPPLATPTLPNAKGSCPSIRVRKEWRNMHRDTQKSYISAIKCLLGKPSTLEPSSNQRYYDDFVSVHTRSRESVHWVAAFLPWHRHFIHLQEKALQACGYTGALPRWDWSLDSQNFTQSPIWSSDPESGFGGDGSSTSSDPDGLGGGTVVDGAFARLQLLYPDKHLLERGFNSPDRFKKDGAQYGSQYYDTQALAIVQDSSDYLNFAVGIEGTNPVHRIGKTGIPGPHGAIHVIIGGDMSPTSYAANDPIFYLHHANVDYMWTRWQNANPSRLREYTGNTVQGSKTNNAKLDDTLKFLGFSPDLKVEEAMDTTAFPYCYRYE